MKLIHKIFLLLLLPVLSSCALNTNEIGSNVTFCCPGNYDSYSAYGLQTENMPVFLRDYLIAEFQAAFEEKGLVHDARDNDVQVLLAYNHVNLQTHQEQIDPFVRMETMSTEINYLAVIDITIIETETRNQVWGGSISRAHQVIPGEYMHEDRARPAFRNAFRVVLDSYPSLAADEQND